SDVTLRKIAREYPADTNQLLQITGMVDKKVHEFGPALLREISAHLQNNPRQMFADNSFQPSASRPSQASVSNTVRQTLGRFRTGESVEQIASARMLSTGTIYGHLSEALRAGEKIDLSRFFTAEERAEITRAFAELGFINLSPVFQSLGGRYDYGR